MRPSACRLNADQWLYFFTLAVTAVMFLLGWNLLRGRVGRALTAIRDHAIAAEAMGIHNALYKSTAFGVSALYTGVAGALGAIAVQFVAPDSFNIFLSIVFLVGIVVGGLASISGRALRRALHPVRAQYRGRDLEGRPVGDLRHFHDRLRLPDADRCRRRRTPALSKEENPMKLRFVIGMLAASLAFPALAQKKYDPGASDTEIRIGNTNPYSGPASAYGTIGKSIAAYFKMVNEQGGINGRKVNFISYDDGYSPPRTVEMARKLVEQDQVLFVFQTLGTPSNTAIHKYMNMKKVPQMHVATGATKWNDPKNNPWTMGWQPNYQSEGRIYAQHILKTKPDAKIAVLYQNDDYGKDYLKGFHDGLGDKKGMIVKEVSYEVSDPTVDSQIVQLQASGADVFFNITTPKFAAQAIRKAYDIGWKPVQYLNNVSIGIGSVLTPAGLEKSVGLITLGYIKEPNDKQFAERSGDRAVARVHEEVLPRWQHHRQPQRLRLLGRGHHRPGAEAVRRQPDARERDAPGRQHEGLARRDAAAGRQHQHFVG